MIWADNMVIPVGAPNPTAAYEWMNYVYEPKNQAQIADYNYYVTPVDGVQEIFEKKDPQAGEEPADLPDRAVHGELLDAARPAGSSRTSPRSSRRSSQSSPADRDGLTARVDERSRARTRSRCPLLPDGAGAALAGALLRPADALHGRSRCTRASLDTTFEFTWDFANFSDALSRYDKQFIRSFIYAGIATLIALLIAYPLAYAIAFRGGRWKNGLLFAVVAPFFTTYLIRTYRLDDDPLQRRQRRRLLPDDRAPRRRRDACWRPRRP